MIDTDPGGVHRTHCCRTHGCKYGEDSTCPVYTGGVVQAYECEWCQSDRELLEERSTPDLIAELVRRDDLTIERANIWTDPDDGTQIRWDRRPPNSAVLMKRYTTEWTNDDD